MKLFDRLFDKREKKEYSDVMMFFFNIAQTQHLQYPEKYDDINVHEYRGAIIGIFAAYLDTKEKQRCVITSYGRDFFLLQVTSLPREFKEYILPTYENEYKYYRNFIKNCMSNTIDDTNVKSLAFEVCRELSVEPYATKISVIAIDICKMKEIIDATFDTFRFI